MTPDAALVVAPWCIAAGSALGALILAFLTPRRKK